MSSFVLINHIFNCVLLLLVDYGFSQIQDMSLTAYDG